VRVIWDARGGGANRCPTACIGRGFLQKSRDLTHAANTLDKDIARGDSRIVQQIGAQPTRVKTAHIVDAVVVIQRVMRPSSIVRRRVCLRTIDAWLCARARHTINPDAPPIGPRSSSLGGHNIQGHWRAVIASFGAQNRALHTRGPPYQKRHSKGCVATSANPICCEVSRYSPAARKSAMIRRVG
jgi:hypothetical protein